MEKVNTIKVQDGKVYVSQLEEPHAYGGDGVPDKSDIEAFESSFIEVGNPDFIFLNTFVEPEMNGLHYAPSGLVYEVKGFCGEVCSDECMESGCRSNQLAICSFEPVTENDLSLTHDELEMVLNSIMLQVDADNLELEEKALLEKIHKLRKS